MSQTLLLTAFKPYLEFPRNVSAEALHALAAGGWNREVDGVARSVPLAPGPEFRARFYDVDFHAIAANLATDLTSDVGLVILMGQAPGRTTIDLERIALNVGVEPGSSGEAWFPLDPEGPQSLRSDLPLDDWTRRLIDAGFPARQSFHAGTYLCNASLYYALRDFRRRGLPGAAMFLHLPLARELFPDAPVALPMETILRAVEATALMAREWLDERDDAAVDFDRIA